MQNYLDNLHTKSPSHKKRFALLASGTITLVIFGFWSFATFGVNSSHLAKNEASGSETSRIVDNEVGPLGAMRDALASSFDAFVSGINELKTNLEQVNLQVEYQQMRDKTVNTYAQ